MGVSILVGGRSMRRPARVWPTPTEPRTRHPLEQRGEFINAAGILAIVSVPRVGGDDARAVVAAGVRPRKPATRKSAACSTDVTDDAAHAIPLPIQIESV